MARRFQTVAAVTCMKLLLMIYNLIFWVTGIVLLAFGLWMKISLHRLLELSDDYNEAAPYVFIGTGAVIVLVGFFACCSTASGQPVLLYVLSVFLGIIFLLEVAAAISGCVYRSNIRDGFKTGLNNSIARYGRGGENDKNVNMLQTYLKCCGINDFSDWNDKWQNNSVPISCCKDTSKCHYAPVTHESEIYTAGCYVKIVDFVNSNLGAIGGAVLGIACFQLFGVMLAFCLGKHVNKAKYEPMT